MISEGILFVSLIPLLILLGLFVWSWRRGLLLRTIILGATMTHELLLVVFPAWYSVFTNYKLEGNMQASIAAEDILRVLTGESIFVLMFALALVIDWPRLRPKGGRLIGAASGPNQILRERLVLKFLIIAGCLLYARSIIQPMSTIEKGAGWTIEQAYFWFQAFFWFTSLTACALILARRRVLFTNLLWALLAAIPLLALLVIGFVHGLRGRFMWAISLLVITGILNRQKKIVALGVAIGIVIVPLFAFFGGAYRFISKDIDMTGPERYEMFVQLYEESKSYVAGNITNMGSEFLYGLALRAQGPRNSAVLYQQYDKGNGAGFTTYLGSIFFPIPRLVWPEKPAAGSTDSSGLNSAVFKVMELAYGLVGTNGPILASAHAYWEGGWGWLVAAGLITGLLWKIIFNLSRRLPEGMAAVVALAFAAALLIDGMLTMLVPLYALIIASWQSVLPVLAIYKGTGLLLSRNGVRSRAAYIENQ